jgi:hypothetical protein
LGFTLYKSGQELGIKLGEAAWKKLRQNLLEAHETSNPALTAEASINGWMESYGPAFRKRPTGTVSFILKLASEYGFRELHSPEYYISSCQGAYLRWRTFSNVHKQRAKAELVGNLKQCG